jgi:predicted acylesterase/phospholipase RssA
MDKYKRCMVLAGGGLRFGIYLGMFAALGEAGRRPDLLLATCGGSMAAAIIAGLPDDASRRDWLRSQDVYGFWRHLAAAPDATITGKLRDAARRRFDPRPAPRVPDVFRDYLFDIPARLPLPPARDPQSVDAVVLGARLLFGEDSVGKARTDAGLAAPLFAPVAMCGERARALLAGMPSPFAAPHWGPHAVGDTLELQGGWSLHDAARVSIADFYYFPAQAVGGAHYIGGVVDLFPIEMARRLAGEVVMEFKESFDQTFSIPAWRAVLGLDGNRRLRDVHAQGADMWIDTSDVSRALARGQIERALDWRRNRVALSVPVSLDGYRRAVDAQWDYGYARATEALRRADAARGAGAMRNATRHNRPLRAQRTDQRPQP